MTVAKFEQPNSTTQTASAYKNAIEASINVVGKVAGMFAPYEASTPNMTVKIAAGTVLSVDGMSTKTEQTSATITAPASGYLRIDRIVIDAVTGVVAVVTGTPAASSPSAPAVPEGKLPVAQVSLTASTTAITNALITDERTPFVAPSATGAGRAEIVVFTASGTWTKDADLLFIKVEVIGSGGGIDTDATAQKHGGCGGYSCEIIMAASLGATETVTVGAVGTNGSTAGAGGTSSFGAHCSATGGSGASASANGQGGAGSGGNVNSVINTSSIGSGTYGFGVGGVSVDSCNPTRGAVIVTEYYSA
jgi:hypothetical protein